MGIEHFKSNTIAFPGVDVVCDIGTQRWPFDDGSVAEARCSHFIEHLTSPQRVHFYNELYRVLQPGGKATIVTPHWASNRAYGDPTHQWPPVSEMSFFYLSRKWREENAPHTDARWAGPIGFSCDFEAVWGYGLHPNIAARNQEFQQFAMAFYKEAAQDMHANLTKR